MVISDKYTYVFIQTPRTASSAISEELRNHYSGRSLLRKHAPYLEFKRIATKQEKSYFVFSTIRNPMDEIVSLYFKLKTDHRGAYSGSKHSLRRGGTCDKTYEEEV